jgi:hypothetical protein
LDDKTVKADKLKEVFYKAVEMLTERDEKMGDEDRNIHVIHWDVKKKENKKHQNKFLGSDLAK